MITAERNDLPGAEQQHELAGVLRGLRLAAGITLEDFATEYEISPLQVKFIEDAAAIPSRAHLYAYLELVDDDARTRAQVLKLWSLVHKVHTERRHARRDARSVESSAQPKPDSRREEMLLETTVVMASPPVPNLASARNQRPAALRRQETRLTLSKPAWRRAAQVSKADSALWPDPDLLRSPAQFAQALESIKKGTGLSYKMLAQATTDTNYPLASSTVHGMCTKPKLPASVDSVRCFIEVCGGNHHTQRRWAAAWQRLRQAPVETAQSATVPSALTADAEAARQLLIDATTETEAFDSDPTPAARETAGGDSPMVWTLPEEVGTSDNGEEQVAAARVITRGVDSRVYLWLMPLIFVLGAVTGALLLHFLA